MPFRLPPLTVPGTFQPLVQACTAWLVTTCISIPLSIALTVADVPRSSLNLMLAPEPKHIVIAGASSRVGKELAKAYAKTGVNLGLVGRNEHEVEDVVNLCSRKGANVVFIDRDSLEDELSKFDDRYPIELLIAGGDQHDVLKYTQWEDAWQPVIEDNLMGTMGVVMTVYKRMASPNATGNQPRGGQIAIISSIVGVFDPPQMCYHNASDAALLSFARDLRYLGRQSNIGVSMITPGFIATRMAADEHSKRNKQGLPISPIITASGDNLAKSIQTLLYKNELQVAYPFLESLPAWAGSVLPPRIADTASWLVGKAWAMCSENGEQVMI